MDSLFRDEDESKVNGDSRKSSNTSIVYPLSNRFRKNSNPLDMSRRRYDVITKGAYEQIVDEDDDDEDGEVDYVLQGRGWFNVWFPTGFVREARSIMEVAWGMIFTQFCISTIQPIATMFGGHLGKLELEAIGLSNTIINITGTSIGIGASTACTTLFSQTYGAKNYKLLGILFQKGLIIMIMTILPCYAIHLNLEKLLILCGQDHEVARLTGIYLLWFMPGLFFNFLGLILRRFAQSQNVILPFTILTGFAVIFGVVLQYVFLYKLRWGVIGSSIAQDLTYLVLFILCVGYMLITQRFAYAWHGWSLQCLMDWGNYCKLAILGLLMVCFEWWAFEITVILSGILGGAELGSQTIIFNLESFPLSLAIGLGSATCVRVGQALGAGRPMRAKTVARVGLVIAGLMSIVTMTIYACLRYQLPRVFTDDPETIELTAALIPICLFYNFCDFQAAVHRGILRGCGKQSLGMIVAFINYYIIALPFGIPLMFMTSLRVKGVWIGLVTALASGCIVYFIYLNFIADWQAMSDRARNLAGLDNKLTEGDDERDDGSLYKHRKNEKSPLLKENNNKKDDSPSGTSLHSPVKSISNASITATYVDVNVPASTILLRLFTVACFLGIFGLGLFIRLYFERQHPLNSSSSYPNYTSGYTTLLNQTISSSLRFSKLNENDVYRLLNGHGE